jgi:hypothetical protein
VNTIGALHSQCLFCILLNSGSSCCLIKKSGLPQGVIPKDRSSSKTLKTLSGQLHATQTVTLHNIHLPEFDNNHSIVQQCALIFDNDTCQYDMTLGANFLTKTPKLNKTTIQDK